MGHSILNIEGVTALLFLFALLLRPRTPRIEADSKDFAPESALLPVLALAAFAPFAQALYFPLLHDSYDLVYMANTQSWGEILRLFHASANTGDHFYRPLAFLIFWLYAKLAHYNPLPWHAFCIAGHVVNSLLVYALARRLKLGQLPGAFAALVFAWHASRPEAVAWVATRVDILATFFTLIALLAALRYVESSRSTALLLAMLAAACAILSKESAYTLPLLFLCSLVLAGVHRTRAVSTAFTALTAVCTVLFVCRFLILGGIGGYQTSNGAPTALHLSPLRTANALLYREWAIAFFPINWSQRDALIPIGLTAAAIAMIAAVTAHMPIRKHLLAAVAFTILAALPAHHLLLIGIDLNGARVLYLPLLGFSLLWAVILRSQSSKTRQIGIMFSLLVCELCGLMHNLSIWRQVAQTSQGTCAAMANNVLHDGAPVFIDPLPATQKGVFFLSNGFAPCVMMNSGGRLGTPPVIILGASRKLPHYRWIESRERIKRVFIGGE